MNNSNNSQWKVSGYSTVVDSQTFEEIVRVDTREKARLIAAAPELLEALETLVSALQSHGLYISGPVSRAIKATDLPIAKARGEL